MSKWKKKIIGKLERKTIMTWMLMWLNWSIATINATFQLLDIYRLLRLFAEIADYLFGGDSKHLRWEAYGSSV